jgi:hypothetical protein
MRIDCAQKWNITFTPSPLINETLGRHPGSTTPARCSPEGLGIAAMG